MTQEGTHTACKFDVLCTYRLPPFYRWAEADRTSFAIISRDTYPAQTSKGCYNLTHASAL